MTAQFEARAYIIWRYADPRDWDVSYDEIADATGLTYNQVHGTIQAKGWGGKIGSGSQSAKERITKNTNAIYHKRAGHRFDENALDVVDLMS